MVAEKKHIYELKKENGNIKKTPDCSNMSSFTNVIFNFQFFYIFNFQLIHNICKGLWNTMQHFNICIQCIQCITTIIHCIY